MFLLFSVLIYFASATNEFAGWKQAAITITLPQQQRPFIDQECKIEKPTALVVFLVFL